MDATLVKILNMATSGSFEESNIAIEQAYKYMKKNGKGIEDIDFNSLYNGEVVAIKIIARLSHDHTDQSDYIGMWANTIYGQGGQSDVRQAKQEIRIKERQNEKLERELERVKDELVNTHDRLEEEQENVEKYLGIIQEKHDGLLAALNESRENARADSEKSQHKIRILERDLKKLRENTSKSSEQNEYMMHAKELQISNIKKELKVLLGNLRFSALQPLMSC
jgi:hypothetical protein